MDEKKEEGGKGKGRGLLLLHETTLASYKLCMHLPHATKRG
jgi:hypothetical protein